MEIRQSPEWGVFLESLGWRSEYVKVGAITVAVRIKPLLGVTAALKIQRPEIINEEVLEGIRKTAKKNRAFLTKIEPSDNTSEKLLRNHGFHKDSWPLTPPKTIVIELTAPEDEILSKFSKDGRYCLRQAQKNGVSVSVGASRGSPAVDVPLKGRSRSVLATPTDLNLFYELFEQTAHRRHFYAPSFKELTAKINAFDDKALLFLAAHDNHTVAGALVLVYDKTAVYLHAASSAEGQNLEAPYLIIWEIIKKCKSLGCTALDLEGIYDARYPRLTKNWEGFTRFKRKFGGQEITYPGAYSRYL